MTGVSGIPTMRVSLVATWFFYFFIRNRFLTTNQSRDHVVRRLIRITRGRFRETWRLWSSSRGRGDRATIFTIGRSRGRCGGWRM
jgi:hypothetical protein